jgi:hypothetical protein
MEAIPFLEVTRLCKETCGYLWQLCFHNVGMASFGDSKEKVVVFLPTVS